MKAKLALALAAAAFIAACAQSPTSPARGTTTARFDGATTTPDTTTRGGNGLGSGH